MEPQNIDLAAITDAADLYRLYVQHNELHLQAQATMHQEANNLQNIRARLSQLEEAKREEVAEAPKPKAKSKK